MFNKTVLVDATQQNKEYVPYEKNTTITENRAPTDDSIRLAKEYEEKIWDGICRKEAMKLESIDAEFVALDVDYMGLTDKIAFKLNNTVLTIEVDQRRDDNMHRHCMAIAEKIATEIVAQMMKDNSRML